MPLTTIQFIAAAIIPVLFAITLHEVAHGYVANYFGDSSAKMLGRLSLNPIKHIDVVGTIIVPAILLALGGFVFGWAKSVPVNPRNLKHARYNMMAVAAAGPLMNGVMALFWAAVLKITVQFFSDQTMCFAFIQSMSMIGVQINVVLMILNFLPIPPLDGSKIIMGLLPGPVAYKFSLLESYGFLLILVLLYFGILSAMLNPLISFFMSGLSWLFHL